MRTVLILLSVVALHAGLAAPATAQSGIRWSASAHAAADRAREHGVPVMFWVSERAEPNEDALDDLVDAQNDAFRDPVVLALTERYFVPCRVARSSRSMAEAEKLGLPTNFGLYIAIVTPTGELIAQINPAEVASPEALADRLAAASRAYRESVYNEKLKPTLTNPDAPKAKVAQAVRTAWKMRIYTADSDIVALLSRPDLTDPERSRLYQLLAAFGTPPCVKALLDAAPTDKAAAAPLARAETIALATLIEELPGPGGEASARQLAAYRATAAIARARNVKDDEFWTAATPEQRAGELDRVRAVAQAVLDAWQEREGRWR